jgi:hypothetical protein
LVGSILDFDQSSTSITLSVKLPARQMVWFSLCGSSGPISALVDGGRRYCANTQAPHHSATAPPSTTLLRTIARMLPKPPAASRAILAAERAGVAASGCVRRKIPASAAG